MLESAIENLSRKFPDSFFYVFSPFPKMDSQFISRFNIEICSGAPMNLVFKIFPAAFVTWFLGKFKLWVYLNKETKIIKEADVILDLSGISFSDGRELFLPFNVLLIWPGLMLNKNIIKCSQAMGNFKNPINRTLAKLFLPKLKLIVARGQKTKEYLGDLGLKNVIVGADLAFSMSILTDEEKKMREKFGDNFFENKKVVGISPSSVVEKNCQREGIDYAREMAKFIDYLIDRNYNVLILPHSFSKNKSKEQKNLFKKIFFLILNPRADLIICQEIYERVARKESARFIDEDLTAGELRILTGWCDFFLSSRFHSMISALSTKVPVLVCGWGHKYLEVLDMFEMKNYCLDYKDSVLPRLIDKFNALEANGSEVRKKIEQLLPAAINSSKEYLEYLTFSDHYSNKMNYYLGKHKKCYFGYAVDENIRDGSASGGSVTAILLNLLAAGEIKGAVVAKTFIDGETVRASNFIATTPEQIMDARSSVYMDFDFFKILDDVKRFDGPVAIVSLPCQARVLRLLMEKDQELNRKIYCLVGLFCGHVSKPELINRVLAKNKIIISDIKKFIFRHGHWRGRSKIVFKDGTAKSMSFKKFSTYQNLFFCSAEKCLFCSDHTAEKADVSLGDIWNRKMKKQKIKRNAIIVRSDKMLVDFKKIISAGQLAVQEVDPAEIFQAQKRSLIYHKHINARSIVGKIFGYKIPFTQEKYNRWRPNDLLSAFFVFLNMKISQNEYGKKIVFMLPEKIWLPYLYFVKFLINF